MYDLRKHNYVRKVLKLYEQGKLPAQGIHEVDIYHDSWCDIYRDGYCNCDPDIHLRLPVERN